MRMVSRTPQARSCCTTLLESYLAKQTNHNSDQNHSEDGGGSPQGNVHLRSLERELFIIGLDAAHVVGGGGVQRLHQQREGAGELQSTTGIQKKEGENRKHNLVLVKWDHFGSGELKLRRVNAGTLSPTEALSCLLAGFTPGLAGLTLTPR